MIDNHGKSLKDVSKEESKKKCGIMVGKSVSQHFHLYMVGWKLFKIRLLTRNHTVTRYSIFRSFSPLSCMCDLINIVTIFNNTLFLGKCILSAGIWGNIWYSTTLVIWIQSERNVQVWRISLSTRCRLLYIPSCRKNYFPQFYAR